MYVYVHASNPSARRFLLYLLPSSSFSLFCYIAPKDHLRGKTSHQPAHPHSFIFCFHSSQFPSLKRGVAGLHGLLEYNTDRLEVRERYAVLCCDVKEEEEEEEKLDLLEMIQVIPVQSCDVPASIRPPKPAGSWLAVRNREALASHHPSRAGLEDS